MVQDETTLQTTHRKSEMEELDISIIQDAWTDWLIWVNAS